MGFFGNLDPEAYDRTYDDRALVRRLAVYFQPQRANLLIVLVGVAVTGALDVIFPVAISRVVNGLAENPALNSLLALLALVLVTGDRKSVV